MKATLQFDLPDEQPEFQQAVNAGKYHGCIHQALEEIRRIVKYQDGEHEPYCKKTAEHLRTVILENLEDWEF